MTAELIGFINLANAEDASDATQNDLDEFDQVMAQIRARLAAAIQAGGN